MGNSRKNQVLETNDQEQRQLQGHPGRGRRNHPASSLPRLVVARKVGHVPSRMNGEQQGRMGDVGAVGPHNT